MGIFSKTCFDVWKLSVTLGGFEIPHFKTTTLTIVRKYSRSNQMFSQIKFRPPFMIMRTLSVFPCSKSKSITEDDSPVQTRKGDGTS